MIAASLFSGIGAPETAMPEWQWPWHAEIERFPAAVMAERHPNSQNLGDVTSDDFCERARSIASPSVIVFGSPCQSYSIAGKRLGLDDPRGNLALVALGIIDRLKPRWFVFENVPGLLSSSEGRDFGIFLRTVDELGYSLAWTVLDAQYFGVAQRRNRVFAVGHSGDWRYPAAVLFEPESLCGDSPPRREAGAQVARCIEASADRRRGSGINPNALTAFGGNGTRGPIDIATAVNAHGGPHGRLDFESETFVAYRTSPNCGAWETGDRIDALTTGTDKSAHVLAFDTTQITSKTNRCQPSRGDPCHPLAAGAHAPAIAFDLRNGAEGCTTQTLQAAGLGSERGGNPNAIPHTMSGSQVRRLTPRECERLQGFPDDYTAITYRGKPAADGPRYKSIGNSMARPVLRWILSRIEKLSGQQ